MILDTLFSGLIDGVTRAFGVSKTDGKRVPVRKRNEKMNYPAVVAIAVRAAVAVGIVYAASELGLDAKAIFSVFTGL